MLKLSHSIDKTFPFEGKDPFVILDKLPHVVFAGNQDSFGTRKLKIDGQEVLLLSVPKFSETFTLIMLDLETLECQPMTFGVLK